MASNRKIMSNFARLMDIIKKWISWQKVSVIIGGLFIIVELLDFYMPDLVKLKMGEKKQNNESLLLKENIKGNISILKRDVNPYLIPDSLLSHKDVELIKDFQLLLLDGIDQWERNDANDILREAQMFNDPNWYEMREQTITARYSTFLKEINKKINELKIYGEENGIDYKFNQNELYNLALLAIENRNIRDSVYLAVKEKIEQVNENYKRSGIDMRIIDQENDTIMIKKINDTYFNCMEDFRQMKNLPNYYKFDNALFEWLAKQNTKYMLMINHYKNGIKNGNR